MGRINIELDENMHRKMKAECAMKDITITEFIEEMLRKKLKNGRRKV